MATVIDVVDGLHLVTKDIPLFTAQPGGVR